MSPFSHSHTRSSAAGLPKSPVSSFLRSPTLSLRRSRRARSNNGVHTSTRTLIRLALLASICSITRAALLCVLNKPNHLPFFPQLNLIRIDRYFQIPFYHQNQFRVGIALPQNTSSKIPPASLRLGPPIPPLRHLEDLNQTKVKRAQPGL